MYLGLDLGTSGLKGILVNSNQDVIGVSESTYSVSHLRMGWSEQDPEDWLTACEKVIGSLSAEFPNEISELKGIGISGQMHGATLLDETGNVLRACMLWNDTRSVSQASSMDKRQNFRKISGNIVFPGFTAPKVSWVKEFEPEIFKKISTILLPKDYLRYWLTGDLVSEMSDSAGTSWFDLKRRCWSETLLSECNLSLKHMPKLIEGSEIGGYLNPKFKSRWNIKGNVCVVGGAGDNAATACGCGVISSGQGFISVGTSGVILAARDDCAPSPETAVHTFCHAIPNKWYQMGVILAATDSLNWLSKISGKSPAELSSLLEKEPDGPSALKFAPYLSGERTPHNDPLTRGAFIGLDISHEHADLTQAVFEGVAYALKDSLLALKETGAEIENLFAVGGGTNSQFWLKTISNILNIPLRIPIKGEQGAAFGAARLAILAVENLSVEEVMIEPECEHTIYPNQSLVTFYDDAYRVYRNIHPNLKVLR